MKAILLLALALAGCRSLQERGCVEVGTEKVWRDAWTQFVWVGKVMVPIAHEAHWETEECCRRWRDGGVTCQ